MASYVVDQAQPHDVHFGGPVTGKLDPYSRRYVRVMGRTFATMIPSENESTNNGVQLLNERFLLVLLLKRLLLSFAAARFIFHF
jgi:hypothetical protein